MGVWTTSFLIWTVLSLVYAFVEYMYVKRHHKSMLKASPLLIAATAPAVLAAAVLSLVYILVGMRRGKLTMLDLERQRCGEGDN